jgi:hypothetical protein
MQMVGKQTGTASVAPGKPREQLDFQLAGYQLLMIIRKSKVGVFVGLITGPENHSCRPGFIPKVLTE